MKILSLAMKGFRFHWRAHLGLILGSALAGTILVGAMLVGDSADHTLRHLALSRLGKTRQAMSTGARFFAVALAQRLAAEISAPVAPVLLLKGIAITQTPEEARPRQVNRVQVLGITPSFWALSGKRPLSLSSEGIAVSRKLAAELDLRKGDELALRVSVPSLLPRDAPLSSRKDRFSVRIALRVEHIVPDSQLGRFSLEANQIAPFNAFVDISLLQAKVALAGKINTILVGPSRDETISADSLDALLRANWALDDIGISTRSSGTALQLESDRVFLEPAITEIGTSISNAVGALTYLASSISFPGDKETRATPFSFVTACSPSANPRISPVPPRMRDNEIIINRWLADHLLATTGSVLEVSYLSLLPSGKFEEKSRAFAVHRVMEMNTLAGEKDFMPKFPGLSDVDSCKDWDVGMPMDEKALNDKDNEAYWNTYRDTPKAFVTFKAGQEMWANRFGNATAIRFDLSSSNQDTVVGHLRRQLDPARLGFAFLPVRQQALRAVTEAMDLGELFLGMSFFLVVSALMLLGLLFTFILEQRARETGMLRAVGFRPSHIRKILLLEGGISALLGALIGTFLGTFFTQAMIWGLSRFWQGAVANAAIQYHAETSTFVTGTLATLTMALLAMGFTMWRQTGRTVHTLLSADASQSTQTVRRGRNALFAVAAFAAAGLAMAIVAQSAMAENADPVMPFFGAGALALVSILLLTRFILARQAGRAKSTDNAPSTLGLLSLGMRNAIRRRARSLSVVGLPAAGCFLVLAVSTMKTDLDAGAEKRSSGTGGFELFGESTLPIHDSSAFGRKKLPGIETISIKVRDGDDASCFNLNRAQTPRLLGVSPSDFIEREAFMPAGTDKSPWSLLEKELPDGAIPGIVGDADTLMWGLQKKAHPETGDELVYRDEFGNTFMVRLVGSLPMRLSVFQGNILVANRDFTHLFPGEAGARMFLFDSSREDMAAHKLRLQERFRKVGMNVSLATDRLKAFHTVEDTYLRMFLVLGALGLLLGTLGIAIVVLRNILERRAELGLLRAVGFTHLALNRLVIAEHAALLLAGIGGGCAAAFLAMLPAMISPEVHVPALLLASIILLIAVSGLAWTALASAFATRGRLLDALRND